MNGDALLASSISPKRRTGQRRNPEDLARLGIVAPFPNAKRRPKRPFSEEEDADLLKGYTLYGPQWAAIQKDPSLRLEARKSLDLRNRFRIKFPDIYAQAGYLMRPQDQVKLGTATLITDDDLKGSAKPFSLHPLIERPPPFLSASLTSSTSAPEHKTPELAEPEETKKGRDDYRGPLDDRNLVDNRNGHEPASTLQDDTSTLFEEWEENTLRPLALTWEEMVTRPIFDIE